MTESITLHNAAGDHATISLFGGQVLRWFTANSGELLYLSPHTPAAGKAVRGGVPVCFPQFANWGKLVKHGFARTSMWSLDGGISTGLLVQQAHARLVLQDTPATLIAWRYPFQLALDITLSEGALDLQLSVTNTGQTTFDFTAALHTYFSSRDVRAMRLTGLEASPYLDATDHNAQRQAQRVAIMVTQEIDRIYNAAPATVELEQDDKPHLRIAQQGFQDSVVWNPGVEKAAALGDMPADDWTRMFCIEAAQIEHAVVLAAGASWVGGQTLTYLG